MKFSFLAALVSSGFMNGKEKKKEEKLEKGNNADVSREISRWDNSMMPRIRYPR